MPTHRPAIRRPPGDRVGEVYQHIRDLIVRGRAAPGARLVEAQFVDRLPASRTSVRAAIQRLTQEGYVSPTKPGRRASPTVAPLTSDDAREVFNLVAAIEGLAAERASELPSVPRHLLVARLTATNESYRAAGIDDTDADTLFVLDTRFHRLYVEAAAGPRLLALHEAINPQVERYVRIYQTALHEAIQTSVVEHAAIVAEIATGSGRGANEAVRTNWQNAAARLQAVIDSRGEKGTW